MYMQSLIDRLPLPLPLYIYFLAKFLTLLNGKLTIERMSNNRLMNEYEYSIAFRGGISFVKRVLI